MNNEEKKFPKTNINWYPGHMAKTKRLIKEKYSLIDVVFEIIDARIPYSSKIKDIDELLKDKKRILIMNKKDLCDEIVTQKWKEFYEKNGYKVICLDLMNGKSMDIVISETKKITEDIIEKRKNKGIKNPVVRALVVGIPNVGKSTFINRMAGKKAALVGNNPGVTKNLSWIKTSSGILLLDSPGILWPKFDNEEVALNLASFTAIPRDLLPVDKVAVHILSKLNDFYPNILKERYNLDKIDLDEIEFVYETIGKKIGAYISGGEFDYDRISKTILEDVKSEKVKGITFDRI